MPPPPPWHVVLCGSGSLCRGLRIPAAGGRCCFIPNRMAAFWARRTRSFICRPSSRSSRMVRSIYRRAASKWLMDSSVSAAAPNTWLCGQRYSLFPTNCCKFFYSLKKLHRIPKPVGSQRFEVKGLGTPQPNWRPTPAFAFRRFMS